MNCIGCIEHGVQEIFIVVEYLISSSIGPKLYKEPSAKSNKYIIQNALAHCCLAGKVNEGQKTKILEVMTELLLNMHKI